MKDEALQDGEAFLSIFVSGLTRNNEIELRKGMQPIWAHSQEKLSTGDAS